MVVSFIYFTKNKKISKNIKKYQKISKNNMKEIIKVIII